MLKSNFVIKKKAQCDQNRLWGNPQPNGTWGLLNSLIDKKIPEQKQQGFNQIFLGFKQGPQLKHNDEALNLLAGNIGKIFGNDLSGKEWVNYQQNLHKHSVQKQDDIDIMSMLTQQLIQLQISNCEKKIHQATMKGQKFIDDRFQPNIYSLSGQWGAQENWKQIKWAKISQKLSQPRIFVDKPSPKDIKQGYLGDCYFLAGLAALAERADRIYSLFLLTERNKQEYYRVKMLYKGKWMMIDMDEYIPFMGNSFAFSKAVSNQLWVPLLQKAWAKMYTSYKRIDSGYPQETLHDLTGAPIKQIFLKANFQKQNQWKYLMKATKLQYPMVCSSNSGSDRNKSQSGVVQGHAYTLFGVDLLKFKGQLIKIVKLRNPWGKGQFKGPWSDDDPNWKQVDNAQKIRLGFENVEDGIFFMPYDNFCDEFRSITIAQVHDGASYVYKSFKDTQGTGCYFKLSVQKQGTYSLQVDKTPQRFFQDQLQNQYRYPMSIVQIGSLSNQKYQKIDVFKSANRMTQQKFKLKKGVYIVKVFVDFDVDWQKDFEVNLAVYAEYPLLITYASNKQASLLQDKNVKWDPTNQQNIVQKGCWNQLAGYGWNKGIKDNGNLKKQVLNQNPREKSKKGGFCCFC